MGDLTKLFSEINIPSVILGIILIGVCLKFVWELVEWIAKKFGVELKGKREKNEQHALLVSTVEKVDKMATQIDEIHTKQESISIRLDDFENKAKEYRKSDTRNEIIKLYDYYTNTQCNPMLAWTTAERDNYQTLFDTYTANDGNGHVHNDIHPAMMKLSVIQMNDNVNLAKLYASRTKK